MSKHHAIRSTLLAAAVVVGICPITVAAASPTPSPTVAATTPSPSASSSPPPGQPSDNAAHLYSLDGWGGVHPIGSAPPLATSAYWPGWDIARGLAITSDGSGGYVLDGWGGLHPLGSSPPLSTSAYWPGWDIARALAMFPDGSGGYVLDGWGGVHPFGSAVSVRPSAYWPGWDIARGIALLPDSTPSAPAGYVLDGWGGLHPFGTAPAVTGSAYWPNWDIARGLTLLPDSTSSAPAGYVLDGWGGLHQFGSASPVSSGTYWAGWDIARGLVAWTGSSASSPGGWVLDGWGGVHRFGTAPSLSPSAYWAGWDIARSLAGTSADSGVRSVVTGGVIQNVTFQRQQYALSCEAASLQMVLSHEGRLIAQSTLLSDMNIDNRAAYYDYNGTLRWGDPYNNFVGNPNGSEVQLTGYGSYNTDVARVAGSVGAEVVLSGTGVSPAQLYGEVLAGHPAVAWVAYDWRWHAPSYWLAWDGRWILWAGPVEHAVAVVGVSDSAVYIYNPISGQGWVPKSTFEAAYATYRQMAVVVQ